MNANSLCIDSKLRVSLSEKLEFLKDRRKRIERFCDPLLVDYDKDLAKLKYELDDQIQKIYVQIHNAEYSNYCKSIDYVLGVKE